MGTTSNTRAGALPPVAAPNTSSVQSSTEPQPTPPDEAALVTIQPSRAWNAIDLKEIWAYRELLYFLTWRDVKLRYKQTFLGVAWVLIQPLTQMLIFTLLFGKLAGLENRTAVPYPLFAFAGLLPWTFFSTAVSNSGNSLVGSAQLITKVYFPRMIVPAAAVCAGLVDLALSFVVFGGLMIYYGVSLSARLLLVPVLIALTAMLALGVGMLLSALNVKYRDIRHALPFLMQIWMFASPVIYPTTLLPEKWRWVLLLNPMSGIIESLRAALLATGEMPWTALAVSAATAIILLVGSAFAFRRMEKTFADVI